MTVLSILDTAPVWQDSSPARALRETLRAAQEAERMGYHRYWVAEHHNAPFIASCAPPVLVALVAAATSRIRAGSGGVMLPNHPPLVVAEQFATLEALHPGRVDLGVGRSPGTDMATARALRRVSSPPGSDAFREQVRELVGYCSPREGDEIVAVPATDARPPVWLLGSSVDNGRFAGELGLPFAFAHHIRPENAADALRAYREAFRPSAALAEPYALISCAVIVADTDERARWLAGPSKVVVAESLKGTRNTPNPTPEQAARVRWTSAEESVLEARTAHHLIGAPDTVRDRAARLLDDTGADELMVMTLVHDLDERLRSYELLAKTLETEAGKAG
ncbi:LLM class flavin-dependent oxidoreductase [Actinomadura kijaniata]|uniref:Luciferase family oxidoreductase group 1 n=1 Tax=Actinomadura namibiensis TaxID=182080 RepID=A0A7W3LXF1_ACTNM|nr:LLM class flavin-dependent oxidoreductase [Actinomadura namibiensis]MBA8956004.1 luciferase family oxidoreductase group 1 [Actinomadura namibiensis]